MSLLQNWCPAARASVTADAGIAFACFSARLKVARHFVGARQLAGDERPAGIGQWVERKMFASAAIAVTRSSRPTPWNEGGPLLSEVGLLRGSSGAASAGHARACSAELHARQLTTQVTTLRSSVTSSLRTFEMGHPALAAAAASST